MVPPVPPEPLVPLVPPELGPPASLSSESVQPTDAKEASSAVAETFASARKGFVDVGIMENTSSVAGTVTVAGRAGARNSGLPSGTRSCDQVTLLALE
jgi:hypothetical protein